MKTLLVVVLSAYGVLGFGQTNYNNVFGSWNKIKGSHNTNFGNGNSIHGHGNLHVGCNVNIQGSGNKITGANHNIGGNGIKMFGTDADPRFYNYDLGGPAAGGPLPW